MVINGGARGGAGELAFHLQRTDTNERMHVMEMRGVVADNLTDALHEMEAVASGARTRRPFYHASINTRADELMTPEQKAQAIQRLEDELGLTGQPRVVVEHVKHDREHIHVAWSRVNGETMTAISDSHNFRKHEIVGRELEREFGHERVQGAHHEREGVERPERCPSFAEQRQADRSGITPQDAKAELFEVWQKADNGPAFAAALEDAGWALARGDRRGFVALDPAGEARPINKHLTGLTAAKVRERLAGIDLDRLPSVDEARAQVRDRQQAREDVAREKPQAEPARDELDELAARQDANIRQQTEDRAAAMWDQVDGSTLSNMRERERGAAGDSRSTENDARRAMDDLARTDPHGTARHFGHHAGDRLKSPEDMRREQAERLRSFVDQPEPVQEKGRGDLDGVFRVADPQPDSGRQQERNRTWTGQRDGWEGLSPEHQRSARQSFEAWQNKRDPADTRPAFSLPEYVDYVQAREAKKQAERPTPEPQQRDQVDAKPDPTAERAAWAARLRGMAEEGPQKPARGPEPVPGMDAPGRERERPQERPAASYLQAALSAARERLNGLSGRLDATLTMIRERLRDRETGAVTRPQAEAAPAGERTRERQKPEAEPRPHVRTAQKPGPASVRTRQDTSQARTQEDTSSRKANRDFADELLEEARRKVAQEAEAARSKARDHYRTERERGEREYRRVRDLIRQEKRARRPHGPN